MHKLTMKEVGELTDTQLKSFHENDLKHFTSSEADLELLAEIQGRALEVLMSCKDPLYKKIRKRLYWLKKNESYNHDKRVARKKNSDNDPNAFVSDYSRTKYEEHPIESIKWQTTILQTYGGTVVAELDAPEMENAPGETRVKEAGLFIGSYHRAKDLSGQQKIDVVAVMGYGFAQSMDKEDFSHATAEVTHGLLQEDSIVMIVKYVPRVDSKEIEWCILLPLLCSFLLA